jgi:PEP-CTERM motif
MKVTRVLLLLSIAGLASADSVTFNFNSLSAGASTTQIQQYMNGVLTAAGCTGCTVTVTGAYVDTTYNADGNVTGPGSGGTSLTLGNTNGATASTTTSSLGSTDAYLATTNQSNTSQTDSQITMTFNGFTVAGAVSFDYEIFPDISCTALTQSGCGGRPTNGIYPNQPDFVFATNNNADVFTTYGATPGTTNGNAVKSPDSNNQTAPQYISTYSGSLTGVTQMDFIDWPATIGVDNLSLTIDPPAAVPEPSSMLLLGTIAAGFVLRRKFRKAA